MELTTEQSVGESSCDRRLKAFYRHKPTSLIIEISSTVIHWDTRHATSFIFQVQSALESLPLLDIAAESPVTQESAPVPGDAGIAGPASVAGRDLDAILHIRGQP